MSPGRPMTPHERSEHLLCGANKRDGSTCRAFAGQGTEHLGTGRCKFHGGSTRNHRKAAAVTEARREMVKLGVPIPDIAPHDALLGLLRATSGHVAWLHAAVAQIDDLSNQEARVLVELYDSERDRLTRVAKACVEAGATDREVHVASSYADAIARALRATREGAEVSRGSRARAPDARGGRQRRPPRAGRDLRGRYLGEALRFGRLAARVARSNGSAWAAGPRRSLEYARRSFRRAGDARRRARWPRRNRRAA